MENVIKPLYAAYECLKRARGIRGTLELELPERKVLINKDGTVKAITLRERLESHKLIEEFMIAATWRPQPSLNRKAGFAFIACMTVRQKSNCKLCATFFKVSN